MRAHPPARHRAVVFDRVCFVSDPSPSIDLIWHIYIYIYIYITHHIIPIFDLFALLLLNTTTNYSVASGFPPVCLRSISGHLISTSTSTSPPGNQHHETRHLVHWTRLRLSPGIKTKRECLHTLVYSVLYCQIGLTARSARTSPSLFPAKPP